MALFDIPPVQALQASWSRERMLTTLSAMLRDYGGDTLDSFQMRLFLNLGVTNAAKFVRLARPDTYRMVFKGLPEAESLRPWYSLDLGAPVIQQAAQEARLEQNWPTLPGLISIIPFGIIHTIESLTANSTAGTYDNEWLGSMERITSFTKFSAIASNLNDQWRQSAVWTVEGNKLYVWRGSEIGSDTDPWLDTLEVQMTIQRTLILDDLQPIVDGSSTSNFTYPVDLPEEAVPLALLYAKHLCLGMLGKDPSPTAPQVEQIAEQSLLTSLGYHVPAPDQQRT